MTHPRRHIKQDHGLRPVWSAARYPFIGRAATCTGGDCLRRPCLFNLDSHDQEVSVSPSREWRPVPAGARVIVRMAPATSLLNWGAVTSSGSALFFGAGVMDQRLCERECHG